jgi:ribonucleotide monophosphatase NagD (HAD superfamily)
MIISHVRKIPFVLLTNGGGVTEEQKAAQMSRKLDLDVSLRVFALRV